MVTEKQGPRIEVPDTVVRKMKGQPKSITSRGHSPVCNPPLSSLRELERPGVEDTSKSDRHGEVSPVGREKVVGKDTHREKHLNKESKERSDPEPYPVTVTI